MDEPLTDERRWPLLDHAKRRMLRRLLEHPNAPRWNQRIGERLTERGLANVRAYAARLKTDRVGWKAGELPPWVRAFVAFCRREVPFHRERRDWTDDFFALPTTTRHDLRREPWSFVPDNADLTDLVVYTTSGTSGTRLILPAHPEFPNRYLPLLVTALEAYGVHLEGGERVGIVHVCAQTLTYTFASVISYLDGAGFAKINLSASEWRDAADASRFLDDCNAELYTGDPFAFSRLLELPLNTAPKGIISAATMLLPGLRERLEERFRCPVIDVYSMNESGPVAYWRDGGHEILPHDLFVEIVDAEGRPCAPGQRGEIVLTGGHNQFLPLLRYRTGDHAALDYSGPLPRLVGLEGRRAVVFHAADGRRFNNVDVSTALRELPLPFIALHQSADGSMRFRTRADDETLEKARRALLGLFGDGIVLIVERLPETEAWSGKVVQYTSELE